jgi:site-specific DNA recombinase
VQAMLRARNPRVTPPRVVTGPHLPHRHRDLRELPRRHDAAHRQVRTLPLLCLRHLRAEGQERLQGPLDPDGHLDRIVTERLADRLLTPERVGKLLAKS